MARRRSSSFRSSAHRAGGHASHYSHHPQSTHPMSARTETDTSELKSLLREAEKALSRTSGDAGEKFDELRERLRDALSDSRFSLENIRDETVRRAKQADQIVRNNPYYAAGIAAGIGALIGIIVSRSCSSSR